MSKRELGCIAPASDAGKRLVALADQLGQRFAERADRYDRAGEFPFENLEELRQSEFILASPPPEVGGAGVLATVDLLAALSRLGRSCASTAIAITMHMVGIWALAREREEAVRSGDASAAELTEKLRGVVGMRALSCGVFSEPGTSMFAPLAVAEVDGDEVVLNGLKAFSTLSPIADVVGVAVRLKKPGSEDVLAMVGIPKGTEGMSLDADAWDALGMRASGSGNTVLRDCRVSVDMLTEYGPWGEWPANLTTVVFVGAAMLAGVYVGIAEAARDLAIDAARKKHGGPNQSPIFENSAVQTRIGVIDVKLAACRAILREACALLDAHLIDNNVLLTTQEPREHLAELQKAKQFVTETAIEIVNDCMTVAGGGSFLNNGGFARLYRDVRAGPFQQPFSPVEAYEYLGKVALGLDPYPR